MKNAQQQGFTLIEILVVMGLIAVLASIVIIALNPAKNFAQARNTQRTSNIAAILDAVGQNMASNKGVLACPTQDPNLPNSPVQIKSTGGYNLADCLVPNYLVSLPYDPSATGAHFINSSDYDTGYQIVKDAATGRITVSAPSAELGLTISISR
jgi:prepilin-type N-terminal cleavage/methylation domain-containing protein